MSLSIEKTLIKQYNFWEYDLDGDKRRAHSLWLWMKRYVKNLKWLLADERFIQLEKSQKEKLVATILENISQNPREWALWITSRYKVSGAVDRAEVLIHILTCFEHEHAEVEWPIEILNPSPLPDSILLELQSWNYTFLKSLWLQIKEYYKKKKTTTKRQMKNWYDYSLHNQDVTVAFTHPWTNQWRECTFRYTKQTTLKTIVHGLKKKRKKPDLELLTIMMKACWEEGTPPVPKKWKPKKTPKKVSTPTPIVESVPGPESIDDRVLPWVEGAENFIWDDVMTQIISLSVEVFEKNKDITTTIEQYLTNPKTSWLKILRTWIRSVLFVFKKNWLLDTPTYVKLYKLILESKVMLDESRSSMKSTSSDTVLFPTLDNKTINFAFQEKWYKFMEILLPLVLWKTVSSKNEYWLKDNKTSLEVENTPTVDEVTPIDTSNFDVSKREENLLDIWNRVNDETDLTHWQWWNQMKTYMAKLELFLQHKINTWKLNQTLYRQNNSIILTFRKIRMIKKFVQQNTKFESLSTHVSKLVKAIKE